MNRRTAQGILGVLVVWALAAACSDSSSSGTDAGTKTPDKGTPDGGSPGPGTPVGAFNGDCSSTRWDSNLSDACWNCFCNTCKDTLNVCNADCTKGIDCGADKHALVGVAADVPCELRAFTALCASDPVISAQASQLLAFDACLINSHDPAKEHLRACEAECNVTYTGDVCQRFPAPDGG